MNVYVYAFNFRALLHKKERRLRKPSGFHWDLVVIGCLTFLCSVFGLQWMCPAAVQTLSHVNSLTVTKKTVPGETPKIDYVIEQRVTVILVGCLHGITLPSNRIVRLVKVNYIIFQSLQLSVAKF